MCDKNQDQEKGECSQSQLLSQTINNNNMQAYQDQQQQQQQFLLLQQQQQQMMQYHHHQQQQQNANNYYQTAENSTSWSLPPIQFTNPVHEHDPFLIPPSPYNAFFNRPSSSSDHHHHHMRILSESVLGPGMSPFGLQAEIMGKMSAQEIMDAKALAASKSHSEAERRRRERINNHLAKLRSLLPSTTKTDKASLLAEVIQHVKELKRQTSIISETSPIPTETDELTVDTSDDMEDGKIIIKASLCCEDRSDLLPDLIRTLKSLRLRTLKAEITTLGGRVKNVLFITGEEDQEAQYCLSSIQEALKAVMEKTGIEQNHPESSSSGNAKRQRTTNNIML